MLIGNHVMLGLGFPLGFFASGVFASIGAFCTEFSPIACVARAIGAAFPALVGYLGATSSLGYAIALFAVSAYALMTSRRSDA